jgi:anti-sigma28 factor (negative regulator of flagellin synthesis)
MNINEISNGSVPLDPLKNRKAKEKAEPAPQSKDKDRVELSAKARSLFEAEQEQRLEKIQERIRQGFYFRREVTEKVVDEMLRDLKQPSADTP